MTLLKRPCLNKMNFSWVGYKANFNWIILTVLLCFTAQFLPAQTIRVKGNIFDAETREPISFVAFYTDENEENLVFLSDLSLAKQANRPADSTNHYSPRNCCSSLSTQNRESTLIVQVDIVFKVVVQGE